MSIACSGFFCSNPGKRGCARAELYFLSLPEGLLLDLKKFQITLPFFRDIGNT